LKASLEENAASFHFRGHNSSHATPSSLTQLIRISLYAHDLYSIPELDNLFFFPRAYCWNCFKYLQNKNRYWILSRN